MPEPWQTPMQHDFYQRLADLKNELLIMASYAEKAVSQSVKAVAERDDALAQSVQDQDEILDQYEVKLDELAVGLLAFPPPVSQDLRLITVTMKTSHDLERVGDEATTIARRALELNREPPLKARLDFARLAALALEMLKSSLDALVHGDCALAHDIIARDREADAIHRQIHRELLGLMTTRTDTVLRGLHLIVVSKCLERVADHATNISEEAVYLYEGRDIRHTGKRTPTPPLTESANPNESHASM